MAKYLTAPIARKAARTSPRTERHRLHRSSTFHPSKQFAIGVERPTQPKVVRVLV